MTIEQRLERLEQVRTLTCPHLCIHILTLDVDT